MSTALEAAIVFDKNRRKSVTSCPEASVRVTADELHAAPIASWQERARKQNTSVTDRQRQSGHLKLKRKNTVSQKYSTLLFCEDGQHSFKFLTKTWRRAGLAPRSFGPGADAGLFLTENVM